MSIASILVVDDDSTQRHLYKLICQRSNWSVILLESGSQAISLFQNGGETVDVVLMDWALRGESGLDCIQSIRKVTADRQRRIPIIAVTAHAMTGDRETCLAAGADDYLSKPFTLQMFHDVISPWVRTSQAAQEHSLFPHSHINETYADIDAIDYHHRFPMQSQGTMNNSEIDFNH